MGNGNIQRIKILLASLVTVIAAIADIYIIVNAPKNYILLGITSMILLVAVYLVISGKMQLRDWNNFKVEEKYDNLITSQKACYLQVKKSFRETGGKIEELDKKIAPLATAGEVNHKKISGLLDSLMQDQKKVAKLTVSRSKENANAIMNSNDKVIEEMLKMQEAVSGIVQQVGDKEEIDQSEEFSKVEERQQELLEKMQHLEDSLKSQIETVADKIQEMPKLEKELISEMTSETTKETAAFASPEMAEEPETDIQAQMVEEPETDIQAQMGTEEPELAMEEEPVLGETVTPESEEVEVPEEAVEETEPIMEEAVMPESKEVEVPEKTVEETEPIVEEAVREEPVISQSNRMMTPEEIAALLSANEEETEPEAEEPEIKESIEEESPAMPDLSDPNRKMSPEDIAALIANM